MTTNLYDLLKPFELVMVKDHTTVRNVKLVDLTIGELQELNRWLKPSEKYLHESVYPSITALKILLSRVRMNDLYER